MFLPSLHIDTYNQLVSQYHMTSVTWLRYVAKWCIWNRIHCSVISAMIMLNKMLIKRCKCKDELTYRIIMKLPENVETSRIINATYKTFIWKGSEPRWPNVQQKCYYKVVIKRVSINFLEHLKKVEISSFNSVTCGISLEHRVDGCWRNVKFIN